MPTSLISNKEQNILDRLFEINYHSCMDLEVLSQAYLNFGKEVLGMNLGIVSLVEENTYKVYAVTDNNLDIVPRQVFERGDTLCKEVFEKDKIIFHGCLSKVEGIKEHPIVQNLKLESYIGLTLRVGGKLFGTLNFSSKEQRDELSTLEYLVVKTMAAHLSQKLTQEIDESMYRMILRNIAHELRTPLNGIIGSEEILKESKLSNDDFEMVDIIGRSAHYLEESISEVSYASKLLYNINEEVCGDPSALLENVLKTLQDEISRKNVHIRIKLDKLSPLKCSPEIFKNAVRLVIKDCLSREDNKKEITFSCERKQGYTRISIKDNGPWLSRNALHVLNSFGTIEGVKKGIKVSGVNLDLTLAATSMNLAGGFLRASVAPDNSSTTFVLSFPEA